VMLWFRSYVLTRTEDYRIIIIVNTYIDSLRVSRR